MSRAIDLSGRIPVPVCPSLPESDLPNANVFSISFDRGFSISFNHGLAVSIDAEPVQRGLVCSGIPNGPNATTDPDREDV